MWIQAECFRTFRFLNINFENVVHKLWSFIGNKLGEEYMILMEILPIIYYN